MIRSRSLVGLSFLFVLGGCGVDPLALDVRDGGADDGGAAAGGNGGTPGRGGSGGGVPGTGGEPGGTGGAGGAIGGSGGAIGGSGGAIGGSGGAIGGTGGAVGGAGGAIGGTGGTVTVGEGESCGGFRAPPVPVCGADLFCELPAGSCHIADIPGTCARVTGICPAIYAPVCGCDGKTYGSDCARRAARVQLDHTGECGRPQAGPGEMCGGIAGIQCKSGLFCDPPAGVCNAPDAGGTCQITTTFCTKDYKPVCGCDGKTYANDCLRVKAMVGKKADGACGTPAQLAPGIWGGTGGRLIVKDPSVDATLDMSCASGGVQAPLTLQSDGSFKWPGTYSSGGGPIRVPPPAPKSAVYFGKVSGDTMSLQILVDGSTTPISLTLTLGKDPQLVRCL